MSKVAWLLGVWKDYRRKRDRLSRTAAGLWVEKPVTSNRRLKVNRFALVYTTVATERRVVNRAILRFSAVHATARSIIMVCVYVTCMLQYV